MHRRDCNRVVRLEREAAGQHPEEEHAEGVDVAGRGGGIARDLLGGDVGGRAEHGPRLGQPALIADTSDPEVGDPRMSLGVEQDVGGLQVAMDEAASVRVGETGCDLGRDASCVVVGKRPARREPVFERAAGKVFERHERPSVGLAVLVEPADVRMRERCRGPGLALEAGRIRMRCQELDRDLPVELEIGRRPDLGHVTAEAALQPVPADDDLLRHAGSVCGGVTELLSLDAAQALVLERARPLPTELVWLDDASGRVLAEPARTAVDLPPFRSSAMDGYAVRSVDTPGTLPVVFRIAAGTPAARALEAGEAMGIATGGVVPDGADAVIPIERVVEKDNSVEVPVAVVASDNIRGRGGDVTAGETVVQAGMKLGPAQIGALAAAGVAEVVCARRPRAGVLTTGTELRKPGSMLGPGEIYEANGVMLAAQLAAAGAEVARLEAVADDVAAHREAVARGLEFDLLVTSGGVSVGPHDLVRRVEAELGVEEVFWRVAVRPGKPVAFGVRGSTLVFGLPGNPVSSLVACELLVKPAVLALQGASDPRPRFAAGRLDQPLVRNSGRDDLVRARVKLGAEGAVLQPVTGQESHMIVRAAEANALVLVPRGEGEVEAGALVRYLPL